MPTSPPVWCRECDHGICVKHGQVPAPVPEPAAKKIPTPKASYQHLYWRARWRNPKTGLEPACLRKHPICTDPFKISCHNPSTVADHIIDHEGNERLSSTSTTCKASASDAMIVKTGETHGRDGRNIENLAFSPTR